MPTDTFYPTMTTVSFMLLGLWWVVIANRPEWRDSRRHRALAYVGSLHFGLPGAMSVLSIAAPGVPLVWRLSFVLAGLTGLAGTLVLARTLRDAGSGRLIRAVQVAGFPVYAGVLFFAAVPGVAGSLGLGVTDLQVEAVIVAILLVFGVLASLIALLEGSPDPGSAG